jgi:EAL domain-containing protein (putative c-di-GMP-specific phosphodiesterase class I)
MPPLDRWVAVGLDNARCVRCPPRPQDELLQRQARLYLTAESAGWLRLRGASGLPETVAELTETWGTVPDRLTLELTEGALIEDATPAVLARLHAMGERLSIDDFGTGYSSLAYLQRLPVDELKVDKSFVTSLATIGDDAIIVRSTIDLAHNLGLRVVAEGVEDANVLNTLVEYGCDAAQGYLFGPPVPAAELDRWLTESPYGVRARAPAQS